MITESARPLRRWFNSFIMMVKIYPLSLVGLVIILSYAAIALLAPLLAPPTSDDPYICPRFVPPDESGINPRPTLPSAKHPFGTLLGYDLYYGCIWGVRTAFRTSIVTTLLVLIIGLVVGSIAGYSEGIVDELLMRFTDVFFALPGLFYVMLIVTALPPTWSLGIGSFGLTLQVSNFDKIILALVVIGWPPYARLVRVEIKKVKQQDFVEAARAIGCSNLRVLIRHILPNSVEPLLSLAFLNIGGVVLAFSTVSFLGFGLNPSYAEWGTIIANGRNLLVFLSEDVSQLFALMVLIPGAFLSTFVLGWSLLGDALRSITDPSIARRVSV